MKYYAFVRDSLYALQELGPSEVEGLKEGTLELYVRDGSIVIRKANGKYDDVIPVHEFMVFTTDGDILMIKEFDAEIREATSEEADVIGDDAAFVIEDDMFLFTSEHIVISYDEAYELNFEE